MMKKVYFCKLPQTGVSGGDLSIGLREKKSYSHWEHILMYR